MCSEIIQGIRVVKFYCWELPFMARVKEERKKEMVFVRKELYIWAVSMGLVVVSPVTAMVATFTAFSLTGACSVAVCSLCRLK